MRPSGACSIRIASTPENAVMATALETALINGFSVETWETFCSDPDLPDGLYDRALEVKAELDIAGAAVTHVLYDKDGGRDDYLLLGDDTEAMCLEVCNVHDFPEYDGVSSAPIR